MPSSPSNTKAKPPAKLRIQPLPRFPDIVLALNVIDTDPPRFHWYLFVPNADATADAHLDVQPGLKMHATTDYSPSETDRRWCFDATPTTLATDEGGLAAAATVGRLKPDSGSDDGRGARSQDALREMLARIPVDVVPEADKGREPKFTCRVWVREALRRMHEAGLRGLPGRGRAGGGDVALWGRGGEGDRG
uniref:APH domain-containing protein n=1 Tax=Ganoderma boninense TaxID=34458 RepID=A0A5K1JV34_9APHY|nr:APH domain-containing protein [Ganoderma boninense]